MVYGLAYGMVYGLVSPSNSGWHEAANNTDLSLNLYTAMAVEIGMAIDEHYLQPSPWPMAQSMAWFMALSKACSIVQLPYLHIS